MKILETIVAYKRNEVLSLKEQKPLDDLIRSPFYTRACNSLSGQLSVPSASGIIAEFKRRSPSRAEINLSADLEEVTSGYIQAGSSGLSILTDNHFFGGNTEYVTRVRSMHPEAPILRKEFIIDPYQVHEAKAIGSDIVLLIAEILTETEVYGLAKLANQLGMEVLLELHTDDQIFKVNEYISVLGVNNRNLKNFSVDFDRSMKLFDKLPSNIPKIAESGLRDAQTIYCLYSYGFKGFLIGEQFMKAEDPGMACKELIVELNQLKGL